MPTQAEIFKIQLPLMTSSKKPVALVYNKSRSITIEMLMSAEFKRWVRDDPRFAGKKTYVRARYDAKAKSFRIIEYVADPGW